MKRVTVIGGGTMGIGIAYVAAQAGGEVTVVEPGNERAEAMMRTVADAAQGAVSRGKLSASGASELIGRIRRVASTSDVPLREDVIIESVPEDKALKLKVLTAAAARSPRLLASNTSALSIDRLATAVADPTIFLGMHFFNPVWSLKLVEIVRGGATAEAAVDEAREIGRWMGKETLVVLDIPGFATSRLDLIASLEAIRMLESGVASAEDIDRAATLAYRHPVGPLRLSDIVGLDVRLDVARALERAHGSRYAAPPLLERMVSEGRLGQKSGQGFFSWPS
ncbi:3-hydroxyacyl-CoA dehydrogenase family protein [Sphingomonas sp. ID0503]|uniref:3-hydroxyacyl-CoA dehydrogenase family protein n=1 Tax=Sphingomonas sp. ID0503 TaxID=3399691 RepID=UPI003AFA4C68